MEDLKNRFNEKLSNLLENKKENCGILTKEKYLQLIEKVKESKSKVSRKKPEDYHRLKRYDVIKIGEDDRLIFPITDNTTIVRYYVHTEEIFDIINRTHLTFGHPGRTKMLQELKKIYKNITCEEVMMYLRLCEGCQNKSKRGFALQNTIVNEVNPRCRVDFMDMQSQPDHEYNFVFVYQDYLTRFVQLRPLKSKRTDEVANVLIDIFTIFGIPDIIETMESDDFCNHLIKDVCSMWNDIEHVLGKPRYIQSYQLVQYVNTVIKKMLTNWLETNQTTRWSDGLRFLQFTINRNYHEEIRRTPFEAMFGGPVKTSLQTSAIFNNTVEHIKIEESFEEYVE